MYDVDSFWHCDCGYLNAGSDRCIMCNARGPLDGAPDMATPSASTSHNGDEPEPATWNVQEWRTTTYAAPPVSRKAAGGKATRTVVAVILLNLVSQIVGFVIALAAGMEGVAAVKFTLLIGVVFFAMVALFVLARSAEMGLRPRFVRGGKVVAAAEGILIGGSLAMVLTLVWRALVGRPVVDEGLLGLAAEGSIALVLFGIVLIVIIGPVVEELVFRGFFAEVFRRRGIWVAVLLSAVAFSIAHLRFAQFVYFFFMGIAFGLIYWRRGLVGSIGAHSAFNGLLLVFAVAVVAGPAVEVVSGGTRLTLPGHWHQVDVPGDEVAAVGPLGARFEVMREETPVPVTAQDLAYVFADGAVPTPPGITVDPESVAVMELPAGSALSLTADVYGQTGKMVMLPRQTTVWTAVMQTQGSERASRDFQRILWSWSVP